MTIDEEDRGRFLNYRPNWAWYRAEPTGEYYTFLQNEDAIGEGKKLPEEYALTRLVGTKYLVGILLLTFLLFVIVPGVLFASKEHSNGDFIMVAVLGGIVWVLFNWAIEFNNKKKQPKPLLILTRDSLKLFAKGEFRWKNIAEMKLFYDNNGGGVLILLLNNGTLIEERVPRIYDDFLLNGSATNLKALQEVIEKYWSAACSDEE